MVSKSFLLYSLYFLRSTVHLTHLRLFKCIKRHVQDPQYSIQTKTVRNCIYSIQFLLNLKLVCIIVACDSTNNTVVCGGGSISTSTTVLAPFVCPSTGTFSIPGMILPIVY